MRKSALLLFILIFLIIVALTTSLINSTLSFAAMSDYQKASFNSGVVKANILNVRLGPGLDYPVVCQVYRGDTVRVFAKINGWYLIQNDFNFVGMVREDYLGSAAESGSNQNGSTNPSGISPEEQQLLNLINQTRKNAGVPTLKIESTLMKLSRLKAADMAGNNYFAHTSPAYGSPFDMMKQYAVKYKAAGENIAGNATVEGAFEAWMKSESHKKNMINKNFNYTGIGIVDSKEYGKIMVQQFVGR